jgi:hypothetical protein
MMCTDWTTEMIQLAFCINWLSGVRPTASKKFIAIGTPISNGLILSEQPLSRPRLDLAQQQAGGGC